MKIILNNNEIDVADNIIAAELVAQYTNNGNSAVAINNTIIKNDLLSTTLLNPNDNVIIVQAIYGG